MNLPLNQKPFLSSCCISLFLSITPYLFFLPHGLTNDDFYTILAAKGCGIALQPSAYIFNTNIVLGFVLKNLYAINQHWPWYGLILITGLFLGYWSYLFALISSSDNKNKILLFALVFLGTDVFFFIYLHYTCVALLCCQGGFFILFNLFKNQTWSLKGVFLSSVCLVFGALLRLDAFLLSILLVAPLALYLGQSIKAYPYKLKIFSSLFVIAASVVFITLLSQWCFNQKADWKLAKNFNHEVTNLIDYQNMEYNAQSKPLFDQIHWSANDVALFRNWYFQDKETCSLKNLTLLNFSLPLITQTPNYPFFYIFQYGPSQTTLLIIFCCLIGVSSLDTIWVLIAVLWVFLLHGLLFLFMKSPPWVFAPLLIFPLHFFIFLSNPRTDDGIKNESFILEFRLYFKKCFPVLLATCVLFSAANYYEYNKISQNIGATLEQDIRLLNPRDNQLFVVWHNTIPYESINFFSEEQNFKSFHIFQLQGFQNSPTSMEVLESFHIKDLSKEIINSQNIFMICKQEEGILYLKHMQEKYNLLLCLQKVFHSQSFDAFRVLSIKK